MNKQIFISFYQLFYNKVFNKQKIFTEKENKNIDSFIIILNKEYGESIGEEWLYEYLSFQFNKFIDADTKLSLQLSWIYGRKGLENYRNRHKESDYFSSEFRKKYNINRRILKQEQSSDTLSEEYRESERNRFSNLEDRLLHCAEMNLFEDRSKTCMFCKNKDYCIKL